MKIEAGSLAELNQWIPAWLGSLSLARGQIVVDQIRGLLERSRRCKGFQVPLSDTSTSSPVSSSSLVSSPLIFLVSTDSKGQRSAVLAAQSFSVPSSDAMMSETPRFDTTTADSKNDAHDANKVDIETGRLGDSATILHAGAWINAADKMPHPSGELPKDLVIALDEELSRRGVKFVQWATDGGAQANTIVSESCRSFEMQSLASLEYLCVAVHELSLHKLDRPGKQENDRKLKLVKVNQDQLDEKLTQQNQKAFNGMVGETYRDTMDCPALSQFRSASQTLKAYQDVDSYDPSRWYFVVCEDNPSVSVGCVIMATHREKQIDENEGNSDAKGDAENARNVIIPTSELVYMALLPENRRQGLGRSLVKLALSEPSLHFGSQISSVSNPAQIVLAVDQQNTHARQLYLDAGFRPLLYENVWGKSVGDTLSTTT